MRYWFGHCWLPNTGQLTAVSPRWGAEAVGLHSCFVQTASAERWGRATNSWAPHSHCPNKCSARGQLPGQASLDNHPGDQRFADTGSLGSCDHVPTSQGARPTWTSSLSWMVQTASTPGWRFSTSSSTSWRSFTSALGRSRWVWLGLFPPPNKPPQKPMADAALGWGGASVHALERCRWKGQPQGPAAQDTHLCWAHQGTV